ncbi:carbon-nitrogen hydrolase [Colletotrichum higginsianum]|uniref:Carbon-nitrogen hydrolase n=2 Tax=Colletotrichum higginsianum TaxID=80884 RepID=H1VER3_COLHI|nr:Carbon-nitrogen hydrolase [Colletotrichum higginsianum IMI 349063]OBR11149.1 Carbon-nitrogen hydrolase [Colletotrichum higginsianum IMI 349063]TIC90905.1 putative nitrilase [Colletotrichum higginsianum]CCF38716.1 carbon-nitrogen hydrolase [Colletotrichum higginsianum]
MAATTGEQKFKVALIQTCPKVLDAEYNFAHASGQIRRAATQGASLAVLPEYHLTGWAPDEPSFALSGEDASRYQQRYRRLAAELHINICAGTIVSHAPESQKNSTNDAVSKKPTLLNTSYFIDHDGQLLGAYTKTNLWIPERDHLTSSIDYAHKMSVDEGTPAATGPHQVFDTPLGPVGILVCWDLAFPEAFRQLVLAGAKIIIMPSYWTLSDMSKEGLAYNANCERMFVENTLTTRAFENTAALIYCNATGPAEQGFFGCSQVALPIVGKVPGSFDDGEEGMRLVDVDMRVVEIAERNYQIRKDLKRVDWHYGYSKGAKL